MQQNSSLINARRALSASWLGLWTQVGFAFAVFALFLVNRLPALLALTWFAGAGVLIWVWIAVAHLFRRASEIERFELSEAQRRGVDSESIFEDTSLARPAERRFERMLKWGLPVGGVVVGAYLLTIAFFLFNWAGDARGAQLGTAARDMAFIMGIVFVAFIIGRYLIGMAANKEWQMLQGGASFLAGEVLLLFLIGVALGAAHFGFPRFLPPFKYVIPGAALLIGVEVLFNLILDFYRPRKPYEIPRAPFDSRLLSLIGRPSGMVNTLNEAINYQFGFEITRSWFWKLLARVSGWLFLFGLAILLLLSCMVIVEPYQQVLITRFGQLRGEPLGPGLHWKLPWPVSSAKAFNVNRVHSFKAGSSEHGHEDHPVLWSEQHGHEEETPHYLIVAPPRELLEVPVQAAAPNVEDIAGVRPDPATQTQGPSVALVGGDLLVQYRIADVLAFTLSHAEPEEHFKALAEKEISRYLMRLDMDEVIGPARTEAAAAIRVSLEQTVRRENLGIEVLWVGLASMHPAQPVVDAYYAKVGAEQERITAVERARQQAIRLLAEAAGTEEGAYRILEEIDELEQMKTDTASPEEILEQQAAIEQLVQQAGGRASEIIARARADRWTTENAEKGRALRFRGQLQAYQTVPELYKWRRFLEALSQGMADVRKILLATDREDLEIRGDFKDSLSALGTFGLTGE